MTKSRLSDTGFLAQNSVLEERREKAQDVLTWTRHSNAGVRGCVNSASHEFCTLVSMIICRLLSQCSTMLMHKPRHCEYKSIENGFATRNDFHTNSLRLARDPKFVEMTVLAKTHQHHKFKALIVRHVFGHLQHQVEDALHKALLLSTLRAPNRCKDAPTQS